MARAAGAAEIPLARAVRVVQAAAGPAAAPVVTAAVGPAAAPVVQAAAGRAVARVVTAAAAPAVARVVVLGGRAEPAVPAARARQALGASPIRQGAQEVVGKEAHVASGPAAVIAAPVVLVPAMAAPAVLFPAMAAGAVLVPVLVVPALAARVLVAQAPAIAPPLTVAGARGDQALGAPAGRPAGRARVELPVGQPGAGQPVARGKAAGRELAAVRARTAMTARQVPIGRRARGAVRTAQAAVAAGRWPARDQVGLIAGLARTRGAAVGQAVAQPDGETTATPAQPAGRTGHRAAARRLPVGRLVLEERGGKTRARAAIGSQGRGRTGRPPTAVGPAGAATGRAAVPAVAARVVRLARVGQAGVTRVDPATGGTTTLGAATVRRRGQVRPVHAVTADVGRSAQRVTGVITRRVGRIERLAAAAADTGPLGQVLRTGVGRADQLSRAARAAAAARPLAGGPSSVAGGPSPTGLLDARGMAAHARMTAARDPAAGSTGDLDQQAARTAATVVSGPSDMAQTQAAGMTLNCG